ncbi:MAG: ABC transporter ATP-binding protein [Ignavibacteria bacterium]|jgi:spermidine/putrescine transport system ATP-binding protein|nr:ABC transporter ATP-binding protein [Ignavibacteria bacterium]
MLQLVELSKENGKRIVLNKISLKINDGEFVSFLGPSGSGKTALLRILAGLEYADSGQIFLRGEDITKHPPNKRNINTVFSSFSLFPDLDIYHNIEFGLNFKEISDDEKHRIVNYAIEMFGLIPYLSHNINELNHLIKYKIALCRALVNNPSVLLLDNAIKSVENKDRLNLSLELKQLQRKLKTTFIYITDDFNVAFALADKIGILQHGTLHQYALSREIYEKPETFFVASYIGSMNFFYARILGEDAKVYTVELDDRIQVRMLNTRELDTTRELFYAIRPKRMLLTDDGEVGELENCISGEIVNRDYDGEYTRYFVKLAYDKVIVVSILNYNFLFSNEPIKNFYVGDKVFVKWNILAGDLVYA